MCPCLEVQWVEIWGGEGGEGCTERKQSPARAGGHAMQTQERTTPSMAPLPSWGHGDTGAPQEGVPPPGPHTPSTAGPVPALQLCRARTTWMACWFLKRTRPMVMAAFQPGSSWAQRKSISWLSSITTVK